MPTRVTCPIMLFLLHQNDVTKTQAYHLTIPNIHPYNFLFTPSAPFTQAPKTQCWSPHKYPNPRYIFPGGHSMKTSQIPMFLHIGVNIDIHKHDNSEVLWSNHNKSPKEMSGNSRMQKHGKRVNRFHLTKGTGKISIQIILYHFKWDVVLWKWPKCPQYMQRTWWQTVATQHKGLGLT